MFRQRVWVALSAIWIILSLQDPTVAGGVLSTEKSPTTIISPKALRVGKKIGGKNSVTLTDGNSLEIYRNQPRLGLSQVPSAGNTLGKKIYRGSGKSRIKKNLKNDEFYHLNDFHPTGLNLHDGKLRGKETGGDELLHTKNYAEYKWQITQPGSTLDEARSPRQDTANLDIEKLNLESSQLPRYQDDPKFNKYKKATFISDVASESTSIELRKSNLHGERFGSDNGKAYFSVGRGSGELKDKSSRIANSRMVEDNGKSQMLGASEKKMQRHERAAGRENSRRNKVDKEIDAKESLEFLTAPTVVSAEAQIVTGDQPTTESFNESNVETSLSKNAEPGSYDVSGNRRGVESDISLRPKSINDNFSILRKAHNENFDDGRGGTSRDGDKSDSDSRGAIHCIGKTKFNKKLPIGLSAANYREYNMGVERSAPNIEGNPIPKFEIAGTYRRTDVARDMRHEGDPAVPVANELAYSDVGFRAAEAPGNMVEEIGVTDDDEIGLLPAAISRLDKSQEFISHTPPSHVIQLEAHEIRDISKSRLIKDELFKTFRDEIHPRGEISGVLRKRNNLLGNDKTLSAMSQRIPKQDFNNNNNNKIDVTKNRELRVLEERNTDSTEVIGGNDHVPRESPRKIAAVRSSREENERLGIIETLNGGYLRSGEKNSAVDEGSVGSGERTTTLNIRTTGTVANSFGDNKERLEKLGDIQPEGSSAEVNSSELFDERDIPNGEAPRDALLRTKISNFETNQQNVDPEITRPVERKLSKTEFRTSPNDTDEFEFLVENSRPIQDSGIERNRDVRKTTIDVRGKLSGNLLPDIQRDEEVIGNSEFIVRNSEKLEEDKGKGNKGMLLEMKKIEQNILFDDTREGLTAQEAGMNLRHESPLFESDTDNNAAKDGEMNKNETMDGKTAMIKASPRNGLRVNLLAGEKNDEELRGEEKVDVVDGVSWTMGKKETNLLNKLWGGKPGVVNLSAFDISGYGFVTERYLEIDPENNERGKSSGEIVSHTENVEGKRETFLKLKQTRKFPLEDSNGPEIKSKKFLRAKLSDKYLTSKAKRAMKSSGMKIIAEATEDIDKRKTAVHPPPNFEEKSSKARNLSMKRISFAMNKSETSTVADSTLKSSKNNTRLFSRSFGDRSEVGTTEKSSNQSAQSFPANMDFGEPVLGTENLYGSENSTEINVSSENKGPLFHADDTMTENPAVSQFSQAMKSESNETHSVDDNENVTAEDILEVLRVLDSDLVDQEISKSLPANFSPTEIPLRTTLDIIAAATRSSNIPFSFNQTDSDNASRVSNALSQWPVKHSAVVEGDLVLGGLMMVHEREDSVTCGPVMPQGGVQALEAMLYTLDRLNKDDIIPGVKIGAHILDDCDKDTYGLEMAVDFIKGSISNIDGAEYHCNKTAVRKVISGVVGAASSVTSIQVANLLRLFRIPQVSFFSTSPELSNKQRFEYFTRTIPSDHYQVKAMVDIVRIMNWSYVSIIYEESNYGIKAFEELEELLARYDICIAIKEKLVKDSGVAEETAYDNIVQKLLTKPRARGCIIFGSDQEVAGVMRAVRRCNATGAFSWIGSDGWSARGLVSDGNEAEVEGTLSVQPQANPVKGFEEYFLNLTVENNRRNPWFVEFWEDHFQCRYPNASWTPYNQKYTKPCTTKERLSKQNTAFEDQLQFVSDAVTAFAYAFQSMHKDLCNEKRGLCDAMKPTKGTELLKYLRKVDFHGLSGDKFKFDKNGDGPARYNIIHFKQVSPGKYKWVRVGEYMEGELRLNRSEIQFRLEHPLPPESVCSLPCEVGQAKKYVEGESCCWHCFNCTQYQVRHPKDETQCVPCPQGRVPDETHSNCRDIPEEFLRPESGWAIGAMSFSATGILVTLFVGGVFLRHNDTPVVRASGRELSYVLLTGILLCYLVTFALVLRPNNIVCGIQRFGAGFCFTVVYAALLTKTNRIARIFNAGKQSAKRPSFISPRSQLIICSGLMGIQILINGVWMIIDPAKAIHHYPTREDNLLVCSSYIDASYMIAFSYPIILIVVCTVYAVLTRKIPEAFNESKHIGFTMYTTCVIWLAFVPLYFGTGNHVALRITSMSVTISLSASVTIACLFSPKLYIILIRPERNVRQSMMPVRYSTTKSSAVTGTNASSMMAAVTLTAATCDQNKAVKRHVTTTIDCSTQSEYYEMEMKEDRINGKAPAKLISRSTQTQVTDSESNSTCNSGVVNIKDTATIPNKEIVKDSTTTLKAAGKEINNVRIGNGPVSQKDGEL